MSEHLYEGLRLPRLVTLTRILNGWSMGLAFLIESVLILCWRLTDAYRCRVSHSIYRAIPIARTLVALDCARMGPPRRGMHRSATPKTGPAAIRPHGSTGRRGWVSSVVYAVGPLRGLPRRGASGAQK